MSQLQVTGEAKIRDIQGPVVANSGVITALDGAANQYVRGDGTLAIFPTSSGGGSSVSYYLNGSVNQGTFGGSTYYQMSRNAIVGTGTNFSTSSDGLIAQFITDANDPDVVSIPSGNWNVEFFMSVSASSGALASFYVEIYKYNGSTFTLLATNVATPEQLTNTTTVDAYFTSVAMPLSAMAVTDRLAVRIFANVASKTVTLYTEDNRLCQIVTTFSNGLTSLNNLTDQSQYLTTGTSGTDFTIASTGDTHTFNLPIASATNTGKLSSTDWSTFNNKQNALTNPITGTGASGNVAYFDGTTSITAENSFNYDASTNRLGVNTSVPNATIGANAGTDSGYSLLLKNDNANYNGIGFGTDSTYGNLIATEKLGTAPARNLTLLNQSGYISITEVGNLGVNILNPNTGLDIYNGTSAFLWLHTANSGITGTDGVRLALFSTNTANLRNYEGAFSITAEGDFSIITIGAENFRVNSADGSIYQSKVANAMLKSVSGVITAAVANTDYQSPISLTTSGSSGAATFSSNILNVPNYTLSGLGGVPTSRTLSINGVSYDLSADRSWTITSDITGSGADGRVAYWNGTNSITSEAGFIYDASTNRLGVNTSNPNATIGADSALDSGYGLLIKTGASNYNGIGIAIDSTYGNLISTEKLGSATARNLTLLNQSGFVSLKENGNFGVNTLNPSVSGTGIDIYGSTSTSLRLHTATSGTTVTDGAGINFSAANNLGITNYENGTIDIVTNGNSGVFVATNGFVGINGATPSVALTVNGGASISNLTTGQVLFPTSGGTLSGSSSLFWDNTNAKLGIGTTTLSTSRVTITSPTEANHLHLVANAPALTFTNALSITYYAGIGMATASNNFVTGAVQGDLVLGAFNTSSILFCNNNTNTLRMSLNGSGAAIFSGSVTGRGPKSQIIADGNSVGAGILLSNSIVGVNRRNWGIFTEQDVEGDFVIKRSTVSGGDAQSGTSILSLSRDGNVGIGATPSAWGDFKVLEFANGIYLGTYTAGGQTMYLGANNYFNGTDYIYKVSAYATRYQQASGVHAWYTSTISGTAGNVASFNQSMALLTNGNLLIGTTTDAGYKLDVNGNCAATRFWVASGGNATDPMIRVKDDTDTGIFFPAANTMAFSTGANERMRINSSGSVQITANDSLLVLQAATVNKGIVVEYKNSAGTRRGYVGYGGDSSSLFELSNNENGDISFRANGAERMRITSGGELYWNLTGTSGGSLNTGGVLFRNNTGKYVQISTGVTFDTGLIYFYKSDGAGSVTNTGSISTSGNLTLYNTTSDYRLKEDLQDYNALNIISQLKTYDFKWKQSNVRDYGMIAHELQEILPTYVYGQKDAIQQDGEIQLQQVDYSKIVPILVKSIQELEARIKQLENK